MTVHIDPSLQNSQYIEYNVYAEDQMQLEDQARQEG